MEQMLETITPHCTTAALDIDASSAQPKTGKYELLLSKIAMGFEFSVKESSALAQQVCADGLKYFEHQDDSAQMKIMLSKIMVHKCIFKISSQYFSSNHTREEIVGTGYFPFYTNYAVSRFRNLPLSLRAVAILNNLHFSETEIAQILNASLSAVKDRLKKATAIINNNHYDKILKHSA